MLGNGLEGNVGINWLCGDGLHFDGGVPDTVHFNVHSNTPLEASHCSATISLNLSGPVVTYAAHISGGRWRAAKNRRSLTQINSAAHVSICTLFLKKNQTSGSVEDKEGGLIKVLTPNFNAFHLTPGCMWKTIASFRSW